MHNSILISYPSDSLDQIQVSYTIELAEQIQTIKCKVESKLVPLWLQLRKFNIMSLKKHGFYTPLFNEANAGANMDTSLFIDRVYDLIMTREQFRVNSSQNK